jgi:hypothetical protein
MRSNMQRMAFDWHARWNIGYSMQP